MAFKNMVKFFTDPAREAGDYGMWLSAHTAYPPTNSNELDPSQHAGYGRVKGAFTGDQDTSKTANNVEWHCLLKPGPLGNAEPWPNMFRNTGGTPWPAVGAVAINCGRDAPVARNLVSYQIADLRLAQGWVLGAGNAGLPPDDLNTFGIAKPGGATPGASAADRFNHGGIWDWQYSTLTTSPDFRADMAEILNGHWSTTIDATNSASTFSATGDYAKYPVDRIGTYGITQAAYYIEMFTALPNFLAGYDSPFDANRVAGLRTGGGSDYPYVPRLGASSDGTAIVNLNEIELEASAVVTPVSGTTWYWTMHLGGQNSAYPNLAGWYRGRPGHSSHNAGDRGEPTYYGVLADGLPTLMVSQGAIPVGAISIDFGSAS